MSLTGLSMSQQTPPSCDKRLRWWELHASACLLACLLAFIFIFFVLALVACLQEVSTILTSDTHPIIFIMNNQAYTIEIEIHDGGFVTVGGGRHHASCCRPLPQGWPFAHPCTAAGAPQLHRRPLSLAASLYTQRGAGRRFVCSASRSSLP